MVGGGKRQIRWVRRQREAFADLPHSSSEVLLPLFLLVRDEVGRGLDVADRGVVAGSDVIAFAVKASLVGDVELGSINIENIFAIAHDSLIIYGHILTINCHINWGNSQKYGHLALNCSMLKTPGCKASE